MDTVEPGTHAEQLASIDELLAVPFAAEEYSDGTGWGGPEHRVRYLRVSRDFWDDDSDAARAEAEAQLRADLDRLTPELTARLGEPQDVDLEPYFLAGCNGESVAEPLDSLSQRVTWLRMWPLRELDGWLGLGLGQADKELPFELLAAVGLTAALEAGAAGDPERPHVVSE